MTERAMTPSVGDTRPDPDPTERTNQAVDRATAQWTKDLSALKETEGIRIGALEKNFDRLQTRFEEFITSVPTTIMHDRLQKDVDGVPAIAKELVSALKDFLVGEIRKLESVSSERFARIDSTLSQQSAQADKLAATNTKAIDTAFQSAEKAVAEQNKSNTTAINKSEAAVADSLKQLRDLFETASKGTNDKIDTNNAGIATQIIDLKSRLDKSEGRSTGLGDGWGYLLGAAGLVGAIVAIVVAFLR